MLAILLALAAPASNKLPPAQALPPPTGDDQAVLDSANALLAAFNRGDQAEIMRWVYPDGRVTGTGTLPNGPILRQESWAQFVQRMGGTPFQEVISDPAIEVDGDAAMIWTPFVVRVGGRVYNCGYDHFDMVRENGAWKTMNLTFSSHVTNCPAE